jgi:predicted MFS family arabinose efflux permease
LPTYLSAELRDRRLPGAPMLKGAQDYLKHVRMVSRNAQLFLLGGFFLGIGQATFNVMRNLYWNETGFDFPQIGDFNSAQHFGTVLMAIPTAILITRFRAKFVLVLSAVLVFAGYIGQALGQGFGQILAFSGLLGGASGVIRLSMAPLFMRSSSPKERVYLFGMHRVVRMAVGVGAMLVAGQVVAYLGAAYGLRYGYKCVLVGAGAAALLAVVPFLLIRTGELSHAEQARKFNLFKIRNKKMILKVCLPEFLVGAGAGLFIPFVNLYFEKVLGAAPDQIAAYLAAARVGMTVGFVAAPVIARRLGMLRSVVATELFSLPFLMMMAFMVEPYVVVGAYVVRQLLMNMTQPISANFAMEVVPPEEQAITNSARLLVSTGGRGLFAMAGGRIIGACGFTPAILGAAAAYVLAAVFYVVFFRNHPLYHGENAEVLVTDEATGEVSALCRCDKPEGAGDSA